MNAQDIQSYFERNRQDLSPTQRALMTESIIQLLKAPGENSERVKIHVYVNTRLFNPFSKKVLEAYYGQFVYVSTVFDGTKFDLFFVDTYTAICDKSFRPQRKEFCKENSKTIVVSSDASLLRDVEIGWDANFTLCSDVLEGFIRSENEEIEITPDLKQKLDEFLIASQVK